MSKRTQASAPRERQPGRRHYPVGEASRGRILEAAERVLARDGYHGFGAGVVNRFYERWTHATAEAMSGEYPDRSHQELMRVAYFLAILADGVCAVFSRLGDRSAGHDEIIPLAIEAIQGLLDHRQDDV